MAQIFTVIVDKKKVNESDFYIMKMGENAVGLTVLYRNQVRKLTAFLESALKVLAGQKLISI